MKLSEVPGDTWKKKKGGGGISGMKIEIINYLKQKLQAPCVCAASSTISP